MLILEIEHDVSNWKLDEAATTTVVDDIICQRQAEAVHEPYNPATNLIRLVAETLSRCSYTAAAHTHSSVQISYIFPILHPFKYHNFVST